MSGAMREKTQADFDLDRFIDMFDEAMTSTDPRVIETLRSLMMIVAMTRPEDRHQFTERKTGPLRQMYDDVRVAHRRISDLEDMFKMIMRERDQAKWSSAEEKYSMMAAKQMADDIDRDLVRKLSMKVNGGLVPPKGLLDK